jgi:hypothetical protein
MRIWRNLKYIFVIFRSILPKLYSHKTLILTVSNATKIFGQFLCHFLFFVHTNIGFLPKVIKLFFSCFSNVIVRSTEKNNFNYLNEWTTEKRFQFVSK